MATRYINVFDANFDHHIIELDNDFVEIDMNQPVDVQVSYSNFLQNFTCPRLIEIKELLDKGYWISALNLALLLPDICSNIELQVNGKYAGMKDPERYAEWFNEYIHKYDYGEAAPENKFDCFNGKMCYALRCRMVHGCNDNIEDMPNHKKSKIKENHSHVYFCFTQGKVSFALSSDGQNIIFIKSIYQLVMQIISMAESYYKNPKTKQLLSNGFFLDEGPVRDFVFSPSSYERCDLERIQKSILENKHR